MEPLAVYVSVLFASIHNSVEAIRFPPIHLPEIYTHDDDMMGNVEVAVEDVAVKLGAVTDGVTPLMAVGKATGLVVEEDCHVTVTA